MIRAGVNRVPRLLCLPIARDQREARSEDARKRPDREKAGRFRDRRGMMDNLYISQGLAGTFAWCLVFTGEMTNAINTEREFISRDFLQLASWLRDSRRFNDGSDTEFTCILGDWPPLDERSTSERDKRHGRRDVETCEISTRSMPVARHVRRLY